MVAKTRKKVGIVGGGLGGLASACTLAARGYDVTLFEKNDWAGGKAAVLEGDGGVLWMLVGALLAVLLVEL